MVFIFLPAVQCSPHIPLLEDFKMQFSSINLTIKRFKKFSWPWVPVKTHCLVT